MPQSEFSLIERYFANTGKTQYSTKLSQGDDAAIVEVPEGKQVVMSVDTLVSGIHFPEQTSVADIAHKALVVNLSDLAAMGARPAWFLLSLTLPEANEAWLSEFSESLKQCANKYDIELIGGDTCHGPLSISIQVTGLIDKDKYVTRSRAQVGDLILVSGQLGNAALGLACLQEKIRLPKELQEIAVQAINRPTPRLCLTDFLQKYASAAIDISDGLIGDLKHILEKSRVGANIRQVDLPVSNWIKQNSAFQYALTGGDDYELCLTVSPGYRDHIIAWNQNNPDCQLHEIGEITESGYYLITNDQTIDLASSTGYQHFGE
jgi:thiamine-monophosphate kinase